MSYSTFFKRRAGIAIAAFGVVLSAPMAMAAVPKVSSLSEAVRNVVPRYDTVVYGPGVTRGMAVILPRHNLGWRNDLSSILDGTGLSYTVSGKTVRIERTGHVNNPASAVTASSNGYASSGFQMMQYNAPPPPKPVVASTGLDIVPYHRTAKDKAAKPADAVAAKAPVKTAKVAVAPQKVVQAAPVVHPAPVLEHNAPTVPAAPRYIAPAPVPPPAMDQQVWVLRVNTPVAQDLKEWGHQAGWDVRWNMGETPIMNRTMSFTGTFKQAVATVIEALHRRGINIHVAFWNYSGGSTAVISGTDSSQD